MGITFKINFTKSGNSEIRRLTLDEGEEFSLSTLRKEIEKIWPGSSDMKITWKDNEGDDIGIANDEDLHESRRNTPDGVIRLRITENKPSRRSTKDGREDWRREMQMWRMMANRGRRGRGRGFRGPMGVSERPPWLFSSEDEESDVEKKEGEKPSHDREDDPAPSTSGDQSGVPMKKKSSENSEDDTDKNKDEEKSPRRVQWSDKMLWWMPGWSSTEDENEDEEKEGNDKEDKEDAGDAPWAFGPGGKRGWRRAMRAFGMFGFPGWRGGRGRRGKGHGPWGMGHGPFEMGHGCHGMGDGAHGMGHGPYGMMGHGSHGMGHGPHGMGHGPFHTMGYGHDGMGHCPRGMGHGPFDMMGHGHGGMGHGHGMGHGPSGMMGHGRHGMGHGPFDMMGHGHDGMGHGPHGHGPFREGRECRGPRRGGCGKFGKMGPWKKGYQSLSEESESDSSPEQCMRRRRMFRRGMRQAKMNNCRWNKAKMARFCSKKGSLRGCSSQDKPFGMSSMDGPYGFPMQRRMMRRRFMRKMMARQMWANRMRKMMGDEPCDIDEDQTMSGEESVESHFKGKRGCPAFRRRGGRRAMFRSMFSGGDTSGSESEDTYDWKNADLPLPPRFMLRQMRRWAKNGCQAWPKEGSKEFANDSPWI